jgi:hypothetical protein
MELKDRKGRKVQDKTVLKVLKVQLEIKELPGRLE